MKISLPAPEHRSYKIHRRQFLTQILLPILTAFVLVGFLAYLLVDMTNVNDGGDLNRWAAISTLWIALPAMVIGIFILLLLVGLIYLLVLLLQTAPVYTKKAQDIAYKGRSYTIRGADLVVRPVIYIEGLIANVRAFFGRR
jgi:uncharacterized membrane protein YhaH (DUF805 family)